MNDEQQQQRNAELEIATTLMDIASCSSSSPAASPQRTRIEKDTKRLLVGSSDSSSSYHSHPQQQQPHPPTSVRATLLQELYSSLGGGAGVLLLPTPPTTTGTSAIATRGTFCTTRDGMVGVVTSSTDAASNSTLTVPSSSSPSPFLAAAPFIGSQPVATPHDDASVQLPPAACLGTHATATIGVGNDREVFAAAARAVRDALDQCPELVGLCTNTNKNNTTEAIARGSPNPQHHHHQYAIQLQIGLPPPPSQYGTLTTATTTDERVGLLSTIDILRLKQLLPVGIPVVDPIQVQAGGLLVPASVSTSSSSSSVAAPTVVVVVCLSVHKTEIPVTMTTTNHGPLSTSVSMPMVPRPEDYGIIPNLFPKHHPSTTGSREESYDHTAILVPGSTGPVLFGQQPNNMEESHHHHTSILVPGSTGPVFFGKSDNTPAPQNSSSLPLFGPVVSHGFGNPTDFLRESSSSMREKCSAVPQQQVKQQQRQHTMHTSFNAAAAAAASNSIMMMRMAPKRTNSMQLLAHISTAMMNPHEQQQQDHLLKLRQEQLHGTTKHGYDATVISDEGEVDRDAISSSATAANNSNDARYTFKKLPPGRTIKNNMRLFVRHSYRDYSLEVPTAEELAMTSPQAPERTPNAAFPLKLHEILSQIERDGFDCIIGWLPHGRSFKIHKQEEFVRTILPKYFVMTKKSSFLRQLNLYGFNRMSGGAYYHER